VKKKKKEKTIDWAKWIEDANWQTPSNWMTNEEFVKKFSLMLLDQLNRSIPSDKPHHPGDLMNITWSLSESAYRTLEEFY